MSNLVSAVKSLLIELSSGTKYEYIIGLNTELAKIAYIPMRKNLATVTAHRELTVNSRWPKWSQPAVTWAVIELSPSRDWAVIILKMLWLSCDLPVTELWHIRDWAVTSPWLSCDLS